MLSFFVGCLVFMSFVMAGAWVAQKRLRNGGWSDVFWPFGLGAIGVAAALAPLPHSGAPAPRQWLIAGLVALWALRLGAHLFQRVATSTEDARYLMLREVVGSRYQAVMFGYLQVQAWVAAFLALTIFAAAHNPAQGIRPIDILASAVFLIGVGGAWLADHALMRFKRLPESKGRVLDRGLWAWSRHPNYVFEWLTWLAYPLFAIDVTGAYPEGWLSLTGSLLMYVILRHMSGVPALEAALSNTKGAAYAAYQGRVSAFFPRPPRKEAARSPSLAPTDQ